MEWYLGVVGRDGFGWESLPGWVRCMGMLLTVAEAGCVAPAVAIGVGGATCDGMAMFLVIPLCSVLYVVSVTCRVHSLVCIDCISI